MRGLPADFRRLKSLRTFRLLAGIARLFAFPFAGKDILLKRKCQVNKKLLIRKNGHEKNY